MPRIPTGWVRTGFSFESGQAWVDQATRAGGTELFALKQLKNVRRAERFSREVKTMTRLREEGVTVIPPVIASDLDAARPWFAMPWYRDGSLEEVAVDRRHFVDHPVDGLIVLSKVAAALEMIHRAGVAHRDCKPANVLLDGDEVALSDFGLCLQVDDDAERVTAHREAVGSRLYVAPENERGINESRDQRPADFYAFGKMLWAVLAGDSPPAREDQLKPENQLDHLLEDARYAALQLVQERLLCLRPEDRLSDWSAVIMELHVAQERFRVVEDAGVTFPGSVVESVRRLARQTQLQRQIQERDAAAEADELFTRTVMTPLSEECSEATDFLQGVTQQSQGVLDVHVAGLAEPALTDLFERQPLLARLAPETFDPEAPTGLGRSGPIVAYKVLSPLVGLPVRALLAFYASIQRDGVWLLSVPVIARGSEVLLPDGLVEEAFALSGPHPQGLEQTAHAAYSFGTAGLDRFLPMLRSYAEGVEEGIDLFEATSWGSAPIYRTTTWQDHGSLPAARSHHASVVQGGAVYVLGGQVRSGATASVETIDGSPGTIPDLPVGRLQLGACVDDTGSVYVYGGTVEHHHDASLLILDRGEASWRTAAPMRLPRSDFGAALGPDGFVYVVGGLAPTGMDGIEARIERYSPQEDRWEVIATLATPRRGCTVAAIGGRLYVAGGATPGAGIPTRVFEVVNLTTGSLEEGPPLPTARTWCSGVVAVDGRFYVLGGHDRRETSDGYLRCVEVYDAERETWAALDPLRVRRASFSAVAVGNAILAIGGDTSGGATSSVERLPLV